MRAMLLGGVPFGLIACGRFSFGDLPDAGMDAAPSCASDLPDATANTSGPDLMISVSSPVPDGTLLYAHLVVAGRSVRDGMKPFAQGSATLTMPNVLEPGVMHTVFAYEDSSANSRCDDGLEMPFAKTFIPTGGTILTLTSRSPTCDGVPVAFDFDGNGCISYEEFCSYQVEYVAASLRIDLDGSGMTTLTDFAAFASIYSANKCPGT